MKTFTVEQYTEAKAAAKELGINPVGKTKEALVNLVNEALAAKTEVAKAPKKPTARTLDDYDLVEGDIITVTGRPLNFGSKTVLTNRQAKVTRASKVDGYIKAHLINPKNGELQKCEIALPVDCITKAVEEVEVA